VRIVEGNRVFAGGWAGVSRFRVTDDDLRAVSAADVVHTGECSMLEDDLPRLAERAARLSFDFSERPWSYIEQNARHADVAIVSLPDSDVAAARHTARRLSALGPSVVAVTLGAGGAVLLQSGETVFAPAGDGPVVDTLGAGDAFIARLLIGLVAGEPAQELVAAATRYATSTCSFHGAFGHQAPLEESQPVGPAAATSSASSGGDVG
jgi:fructoselysine 6-kinase